MKKMNKRILRSALAVFTMCGAFSMTAVSVSAEETERLPETTTVVTSDVVDVDNLPVISVTTPDENENDGKYTIDINDIPDIEGVDKSDIIAAVGGLPAGNGTLLEDVSSDVVDRQFITIQSKNGNTFYIVIDKDSKGNENVYFMNLVDEYDLMAFSEDFPEEVKSELGVKDDEKTPVVTDESGNPVEETKSDGEKADDKANEAQSGGNSLLIPILLLLAGGGGAFYYFKVYKPKQNSKPKKAVYDEDEEYEDEPDEVLVNEDNEDE